jgi:hypothetical protein
MKIVQVRSPFKIVVNESGQLFTQVKLYIWNKGDTEPTIPTYIFSKSVPSLANRESVFNISNQLQEYIEPISVLTNYGVIEEENPKSWCFFKVERFSGIDIENLDLLDTTNYVGLNGFTDYMSGNQVAEILNYKLLTPLNNLDTNNNNSGYFNLLLDLDLGYFVVNYSNSQQSIYINLNANYSGFNLLKIPYTNNDLSYQNLPITVSLYDGEITAFEFKTNPTEECKYNPVECTYQNSLGGWQFLTFFKAQTNSISVKGSEFNLLPNQTNYNPLRGQSKVFNLNGNQSVKLNTGWVDENYSILMQDLLLSETVLVDSKPAKVKTNSLTFKTRLKDKMINYEIDFEYSFDLKNNVV